MKITAGMRGRYNMCNAFSGIATRTKVYWKFAMDSHNNIVEHFKLKDDRLGKIIPFEISPKNNDYLEPDDWVFKFDDECPDWWKSSHEKMCWSAFRKWQKKLDAILVRKKIVHPFRIKKPDISNYHIGLLKDWDSVGDIVVASVWDSVGDSVWASVRDSVWDSVGASVWDSVWDSVWASVWDSVWDSVWASVWDSVKASVWDSVGDSVGDSVWDSVWDSVRASVGAYSGSFFKLKRSEWKYTEKVKCKGYPFESLVKLWEMGFVPSFDGKIWRLHGGKSAKVLFEISKKDLMKNEK